MKKFIRNLTTAVVMFLVSMTVFAGMYKYDSLNGTTYYVSRVPTGLTTDQKALFKALTAAQEDAITPTMVSNRNDVKTVVLADTVCPEGKEGTPPNCTDIPVTSATPTLDASVFSTKFADLSDTDKGKLELVLSSLDDQSLVAFSTMFVDLTDVREAYFISEAKQIISSTNVPSSASEIESLANALAQKLLQAGEYVEPSPEPEPIVYNDAYCKEQGFDRANGTLDGCINDPDPVPVSLLDGKEQCGKEWEWCSFPSYGTYDVWFGDERQLAGPKTVTGWGTQCNEGEFSQTDIPGNKCYIGTGATEPTPVDPTPTDPIDPTPTDPTPTDPHQGHSMLPYVDVTKLMKPVKGSNELKIMVIPQSYKDNWPDTYTTRPDKDTGGAFRVTGNASHMNFDDPIIYPNQPGLAHLHTWFCNDEGDAFSTPDSLKNSGGSTCQGGIANRSAYWAPTPIKNGTPLVPSWAIFYYKGGQVRVPNGLMMIAGDHKGSPTNVQDDTKIYWSCNASTRGGQAYYERKPYILPCSGDLMATVTFPNCWDGKRLNTANGKAHMAYGNNGACPATHPVSLPNVTANIHYDVDNTDGIRLSSDAYEGGRGGYSLHFDYMFAWDEKILETWQINCLDNDQDCHSGLLGDGRYLIP